MPRIELSHGLYLDESKLAGAGRGVFTHEQIPEGALIEQCPVVALHDTKDRARLRKTGLVNYYFLWGEERVRAALCLGWGSVYNHSFSPNARYEKVMDEDRMDFYALRTIEPGEEITVNYNGVPSDTRPLRIPGIPQSAGGPVASPLPWPIAGLVRRAKVYTRLLLGKQAGMPVLLLIPAF